MASTTACTLALLCKDCHQPVSESGTNKYRLVGGVLYGWCNECFDKQQRRLKYGIALAQPGEPVCADETDSPGSDRSRK
jgi:hypothetical protein